MKTTSFPSLPWQLGGAEFLLRQNNVGGTPTFLETPPRHAIQDVLTCRTLEPGVNPLRVIRSFSCKETEKLFEGLSARALPADIRRRARTKLLVLHAATSLDDLKCPPGNRLEALAGGRNGQHSIRINQQYRLCFRWSEGGAEQVEITDYH